MKKQLFILLAVSLAITPLIGQYDLQWLVYKGKGKRGLENPSTNKYFYNFDPAAQFNLEGIKHPNLEYYDYAKNDLFIIYANGSHYNSRIKDPSVADPGFFYPAVVDLSILNHHFNPGSSTSQILYLYLSNIYEGDDPPGTVKARAGDASAGSDAFDLPTYTTTTPSSIFADHDVVRDKDITLILNNAQIKAASGSLATDFTYYLHINSIFESAHPETILNDEFFSPHPIFDKATGASVVEVPVFPTECGEYLGASNTIKIVPGTKPFTYVNLWPSPLLADYYPGDDGLPVYEAVFTATSSESGGTVYASMTEKIRDSHDPNFIRIDSICKDKSGDFIVFCHMQCENNSETSPSLVTFTFDLPRTASSSCFEVTDWFIGGSTAGGTVKRDGSKVKCIFNNHKWSGISKCTPPDETQCTGYINFKYKLESTVEIEKLSTDIWVKHPTVIFDTRKYPIKLYKDLKDIDYYGQNAAATYFRPVISTHLCSIECSKL